MFCSSCGKQNVDQARFCTSCGSQIQTAVNTQPQTQTPPPVNVQSQTQDQTRTQTVSAPPLPGAKTLNQAGSEFIAALNAKVKDLFDTSDYEKLSGPGKIRAQLKSPVVLGAIIAYTLVQVLGLINASSGGGLFNQLYWIASLADAEQIVYELQGYAARYFTTVELIQRLPQLIIAAGMWIAYLGNSGNSSPDKGAAGFSLIKILLVIECVLVTAGFALAAFLGLGMLFAVPSSLKGAVIMMLLLFGGFAALKLMYYFKSISTLNAISTTCASEVPSGKVSSYVAVLTVLGGVLSFFGMFTSQGLGILAALASAAASILFGVFLFNFRALLKELSQ